MKTDPETIKRVLEGLRAVDALKCDFDLHDAISLINALAAERDRLLGVCESLAKYERASRLPECTTNSNVMREEFDRALEISREAIKSAKAAK